MAAPIDSSRLEKSLPHHDFDYVEKYSHLVREAALNFPSFHRDFSNCYFRLRNMRASSEGGAKKAQTTDLCHHIVFNTACPRARCFFAHSFPEKYASKKFNNPAYKTGECREKGVRLCPYGFKCDFLHQDVWEIQCTIVNPDREQFSVQYTAYIPKGERSTYSNGADKLFFTIAPEFSLGSSLHSATLTDNFLIAPAPLPFRGSGSSATTTSHKKEESGIGVSFSRASAPPLLRACAFPSVSSKPEASPFSHFHHSVQPVTGILGSYREGRSHCMVPDPGYSPVVLVPFTKETSSEGGGSAPRGSSAGYGIVPSGYIPYVPTGEVVRLTPHFPSIMSSDGSIISYPMPSNYEHSMSYFTFDIISSPRYGSSFRPSSVTSSATASSSSSSSSSPSQSDSKEYTPN